MRPPVLVGVVATERVDAVALGRRGRGLVVARLAVVLLLVSTVGLTVAAIPARYGHLSRATPAVRSILAHLGVSVPAYAALEVMLEGVIVAVFLAVAVLIVWRRPNERMGLFVAAFLVTFGAAFSPLLYALAEGHPAVDLYLTLLGAVGYTCLNGLFYLFPDGRLVPRWAWIPLVGVVLGQLPFSLPPTNPYAATNWPAWLIGPVVFSVFGAAVSAQLYRYRHVSDAVQRQQTKWVVYGAATAVGVNVLARALGSLVPARLHPAALDALVVNPVVACGFVLIPLSIGVAVLRYRLWDIDLIINRTLVYGALTALVVGGYVLVVGSLGALFQARGNLLISLLATGLVALAFQPFRLRLQRGVNRLLYGERDDPYAVLTRLGQRLEATLEPGTMLPTIVETVAQALKVPYVAIALRRAGELVLAAQHGTPGAPPLRLPLVYGRETVGELQVSPRSGSAAFSAADRRLLDALARQAGIAAHAERLTVDLQRSRERLVTAREEERRRLRRDLHDGLGPTLAGFTLTIGAIRNVLTGDPAAADSLLADLGAGIEGAVAEIRRVVYGLRPPALDELGLAGALRARAAACGDRPQTRGLQVSVEAPDTLPPLPAAVEVAAYRSAEEALTNVVRHARARTCRVRLAVQRSARGPTLCLEITDDGVGLPAERHAGIGLHSLRERAEELGGTCVVEAGDATRAGSAPGTRVAIRLPLAQE